MRDRQRLLSALKYTALFLGLLWLLELGKQLLGWQLYGLGVYPGEVGGLVGLMTAPLVHGSAAHLAANSVGLVVLLPALLYGYPKSKWWTIALIWLLSGLGVWLWGRESYHYGASGLTHGLFFYLFFVSLFRRDKRSIALMMIAFFMFGGMFYSIFPQEEEISFESHLFGGGAGVLAAILFWRKDPKQLEKRYAWEKDHNEHESSPLPDEEEDVIGDQWQLPEQEGEVVKPQGEESFPQRKTKPFFISRN